MGKERQRNRNKYIFQGKEICQEAFLYLENVTIYQLKSIRKHVIDNGVAQSSQKYWQEASQCPRAGPLPTLSPVRRGSSGKGARRKQKEDVPGRSDLQEAAL